jgi:thiol-disulfide isomerase/thioredoxin
VSSLPRSPRAVAAALTCVATLACCASARPAQQRAREPGLASLDLTTLDGTPIEITGPGPTRLVEVWATWCEPCERAAAAARPVLARHALVAAYAVALDTDRTLVERHAGLAVGTVLLVRGGAAAATRAGFGRLPAFVALDARGRAVGAVTGATPNLAAQLERLIGHAEGRVGERD